MQRKYLCLQKDCDETERYLGCEGYNIVQNNGAAAGQSVFHYHMHLIPRYKDDTVDIKWKLGTLTEEDKEYILKKMNEE